MSTRIITSISSDIGIALAKAWVAEGHRVIGTYRTASTETENLAKLGIDLIPYDLARVSSVNRALSAISSLAHNWDVLIQAPGLQDPVGPFMDCDFDEWESSVTVNFSAQLRLTQGLLKTRNKNSANGPLVLFFAGGGTNNATVNYSAYTISKVALIKMCELLDAEVPDTRFTILGPGWVKTKIHDATLQAGDKAGDNLQRTLEKLDSNECVPMDQVIACCDWIVNSPRDVIGGRNFSLVFDDWGNEALDVMLRDDPDMYKLRRSGNGRLERNPPISEATVKR